MKRLPAFSGWTSAVMAAVGLLAAYTWAEGVWTGRWNPSDAPRAVAARLKQIPRAIGAWDGEDSGFDERQLALGGLDGYLYRIYSDSATGDQVHVLIVCGRPGPVSVHTPDVCYRGLGFSALSHPVRKSLALDSPGDGATCWTADFQRPIPGGTETLRIAWSWFAAGQWQAADRPRFEFAREPALVKAYLIHPLADPRAAWEDDSIPRLARSLWPLLSESLGESQRQGEGAAGEERSPKSGSG
jgi:hypothetical protein